MGWSNDGTKVIALCTVNRLEAVTVVSPCDTPRSSVGNQGGNAWIPGMSCGGFWRLAGDWRPSTGCTVSACDWNNAAYFITGIRNPVAVAPTASWSCTGCSSPRCIMPSRSRSGNTTTSRKPRQGKRHHRPQTMKPARRSHQRNRLPLMEPQVQHSHVVFVGVDTVDGIGILRPFPYCSC